MLEICGGGLSAWSFGELKSMKACCAQAAQPTARGHFDRWRIGVAELLDQPVGDVRIPLIQVLNCARVGWMHKKALEVRALCFTCFDVSGQPNGEALHWGRDFVFG